MNEPQIESEKVSPAPEKPTHYHWHVYDKHGEKMTTCEIKGGRDKVKRTCKEIARWQSFGSFSRIYAGKYLPGKVQ